MKFLLLYLQFLLSFSTLLDQVRIEVVDKALLELPKRESIDILKFVLEMSNAQDKNSMTDAESAYFAYKWIGQNIEYDCLSNKFGNSSTLPATTYKNGKGGEVGISALFNMICNFLNIESNTIFGIKKTITRNFTNLIQFNEYAWNYILIDNKYYLLDVTSGTGQCSGDRFYRSQKDDYFAMDPELSIRYRFPNDKIWQLLSKPISEAKFKSQAILYDGFFKYFKTITPDVQTIKNQNEIKIKLTVKDPKIKKLYFMEWHEIENEMPIVGFEEEVMIVNGTCEYIFYPFGTGYADVDISEDNKKYYGLVRYEIHYEE